MNSKSRIITIIGAVLLIGVIGIVALTAGRSGPMDNTQTKEQSNSGQKNANEDAVATNTVIIEDYKFKPAKIIVKAGTTVTWINKDTVKHTVTGNDKAASGLDSDLFGKDGTFTHIFGKPGENDYYCLPHPYMKGMVVVTE